MSSGIVTIALHGRNGRGDLEVIRFSFAVDVFNGGVTVDLPVRDVMVAKMEVSLTGGLESAPVAVHHHEFRASCEDCGMQFRLQEVDDTPAEGYGG